MFRPAATAALAAVLALTAAPALAGQLACDGPFAIDSSEARLVEAFGRDNVVTGEVDGPEGTTMIATTVFPDDPERRFQAVWWDDETLSDPSFFTLARADIAPGGLRIGMPLAEVEALNGEPFTMLGFGWDYGGAASFASGRLSALPGDCLLSVSFDPTRPLPEGTDAEPIEGDKEVASDLPLLRAVEPVVYEVRFGYPHPDFRAD